MRHKARATESHPALVGHTAQATRSRREADGAGGATPEAVNHTAPESQPAEPHQRATKGRRKREAQGAHRAEPTRCTNEPHRP